VHRLRLGSIEPTELTDELLATLAASPVLCPHLHIPLQAGDESVLRRMGRTYDREFFARLVRKVRAVLPSAAICLDVITGFPGETEQEFANTYDFIAGLAISDLHVFPYSKRPGTPAASLPDQVPGNISRERAERLRSLAAEKYRQFAEGFLGHELEVVVEGGSRGGLLKGLSVNYLEILFPGAASFAGQCVRVTPVSWLDGALRAELVQ
jgi:threonylcarbamoyladenosine tRNA methylthiotransferase MtaB